MSTSDLLESPITVGELTFPKPTIRATAALGAKLQTQELKRLGDVATAQKLSPEAAARFVMATAGQDYSLGHLQDWATTINGSLAICVASLVQGGRSEADAKAVLEAMTATAIRDIALELVDHPGSPRRVLQAKAEADAREKEKQKNPQ